MDKIRTPDERFKDLVDWPFEPRYVNLDEDLRARHVDDDRVVRRVVVFERDGPVEVARCCFEPLL